MIKKQVESKILKKLEGHKLNDEFAIVKLEVITSLNNVDISVVTEGVVNVSNLDDWVGGELVFNQYILVDNSVIEKYKKYGMPGSIFATVNWNNKDLEEAISKNPYTDFKNGEIKNKQFVLLSGYDNSLKLIDGTLVTKPLHFNYMNGQIDNKNYNLKKLAKLLYKRDDVIFYCNKRLLTTPLKEGELKEIIQGIPYYNIAEGKSETIDFFVTLPQKKFEKMKKNLGFNKTDYDMFDYVRKHDLLGIESARLIDNINEVVLPKKNKLK